MRGGRKERVGSIQGYRGGGKEVGRRVHMDVVCVGPGGEVVWVLGS